MWLLAIPPQLFLKILLLLLFDIYQLKLKTMHLCSEPRIKFNNVQFLDVQTNDTHISTGRIRVEVSEICCFSFPQFLKQGSDT